MKANEKDLGKVTLTCNGLWSSSKEYERLCLVHDGLYSSYISRKNVPIGIKLANADYWQPVASLKEDFKTEVATIRKEFIQKVAYFDAKYRHSRIVVKDEEERNALTIEQVATGCEVYELDTKLTYILDLIIPDSGAKRWHLEADGRIDSEPKHDFEGSYCNELTVDRAIKDRYGNIIDLTYMTQKAASALVEEYTIEHLTKIGAIIIPESIKPCHLSKQVIELLNSRVVSNAADEEDLTVYKENNGVEVLKFKDKEYEEGKFTGDGIVYLRKNFIGNVNVLNQIDVSKPNTTYIIKYDFCLYGKTITIPQGCTLDFQGGHIMNGTIILNNTKIKGTVGALSDYLKCNVAGNYANGQIDYRGGKLGYWNNNVFIGF